jgi:hypothetical protein
MQPRGLYFVGLCLLPGAPSGLPKLPKVARSGRCPRPEPDPGRKTLIIVISLPELDAWTDWRRGGGTTALAQRDHPEDGPHHGQSGQASAVVKHFDGTVLSKNPDARTFRMRPRVVGR